MLLNSICYERQNSRFLDLYFREFTAAINFACSNSCLRIGENYIIFSKIARVQEPRFLLFFMRTAALTVIIISTCVVFLRMCRHFLQFSTNRPFPSRIPLQCARIIAPERGWGGHSHTFAVFLSTLTSSRRYCLLECGKGLYTWNKETFKFP